MKLKMKASRTVTPAKSVNCAKQAKPAAKTAKPTPKADARPALTKAAKGGRSFVQGNIDLTPYMIARRAPRRAIVQRLRGTVLPTDPKRTMFLVSSGAKGKYVSPVKSDDGNFYLRLENDGTAKYGMIDQLPETPGFKMELLNRKQMLAAASEINKVITVQHVGSKTDVTVALLNPFDSVVVAAVTKQKNGQFGVVTMHHVRRNSKPEVQYVNPRDVRKPKAFLSELAA